MAARSKPAEVDPDATPQELPEETRLDTDVHAPATNAPGDAPADTTDPSERASTIVPQAPSPEALRAGTILGAVPLPDDDTMISSIAGATNQDGEEIRVEEYDAVDPITGAPLRIRRFIDGPDAGKSFRV